MYREEMGARTHIMDAQKVLEQKGTESCTGWNLYLHPKLVFPGGRCLCLLIREPLRLQLIGLETLRHHQRTRLFTARCSASWDMLEDKASD